MMGFAADGATRQAVIEGPLFRECPHRGGNRDVKDFEPAGNEPLPSSRSSIIRRGLPPVIPSFQSSYPKAAKSMSVNSASRRLLSRYIPS